MIVICSHYLLIVKQSDSLLNSIASIYVSLNKSKLRFLSIFNFNSVGVLPHLILYVLNNQIKYFRKI